MKFYGTAVELHGLGIAPEAQQNPCKPREHRHTAAILPSTPPPVPAQTNPEHTSTTAP